jgi:archaemetzincin
MNDQTIAILPVDDIEEYILNHIARAIEKMFRKSTLILPYEDISTKFPGLLNEGKYNSTAVLLYLSERLPQNSVKLLAITQLDLYSPIFAYLYGEAQLNGTFALMSLFRLRQEFYHQTPDGALFLSRCEKEALHELAHTYGLAHCADRNCLMYPSSTIDDTDAKSNTPCPTCTSLLQRTR